MKSIIEKMSDIYIYIYAKNTSCKFNFLSIKSFEVVIFVFFLTYLLIFRIQVHKFTRHSETKN